MKHYDVIIVGGGLAGLTAAIDLSGRGYDVLVLEKKQYPHHKVCGEYVSREVLPYLENLGVDLVAMGAVEIDNMEMSSVSGKSIETRLPLGGVGLSRYAFDQMLYKKALENGVTVNFETVQNLKFKNVHFEVVTNFNEIYTSNTLIGAYGKRSSLDLRLQREFTNHKTSWLAVKAHYQYDEFPDNKVALHNFEGGYAGLSKTETGAVNFCYLTSYKSFQKERSVRNFNEKVIAKNPYLNDFLNKSKPQFENPLTIAQINFGEKKPVDNHVLMCGDTAGLIHPLCGNGMAMAIHSAKIAAGCIHRFFQDKKYERNLLERDYSRDWNTNFKTRIWMGRQLQSLFLNKELSAFAQMAAVKSPAFLRKLIRMTHGKPILC